MTAARRNESWSVFGERRERGKKLSPSEMISFFTHRKSTSVGWFKKYLTSAPGNCGGRSWGRGFLPVQPPRFNKDRYMLAGRGYFCTCVWLICLFYWIVFCLIHAYWLCHLIFMNLPWKHQPISARKGVTMSRTDATHWNIAAVYLDKLPAAAWAQQLQATGNLSFSSSHGAPKHMWGGQTPPRRWRSRITLQYPHFLLTGDAADVRCWCVALSSTCISTPSPYFAAGWHLTVFPSSRSFFIC